MMWWNKKKHWYVCTLGVEGDSLSLYKYGKEKMTREELRVDVEKVMKEFPTLFVIFSAKQICTAGICNAYDLDSIVEKLKSSAGGIEVLSGGGVGLAKGGDKKVMN